MGSLASSESWRLAIEPIQSGVLPDSWLALMRSCSRLIMDPIATGILPDNRLLPYLVGSAPTIASNKGTHKRLTHKHFLPPFDPEIVPAINRACHWDKLGLSLGQTGFPLCKIRTIPGSSQGQPDKSILRMCLFLA